MLKIDIYGGCYGNISKTNGGDWKMKIGRGDRRALDAATSFKTRKDHIKSTR